MSASIGAAIKAYLETQGLGIEFFRDAPPTGKKRPYGVIFEGVALTMDPEEDGGPANGATATGVELVQLSLFQTWLKDDGTLNEDPLLADRITNAIHGSRLLSTPASSVSPKLIYHVRQQGRPRFVDRESNVVHHPFTLAINRVI